VLLKLGESLFGYVPLAPERFANRILVQHPDIAITNWNAGLIQPRFGWAYETSRASGALFDSRYPLFSLPSGLLCI
jgi:hypothetical protein